ncbi:hypothetical protein NKH18_07005 [Streptomyces sp. M10(2022)]
MPLRQRGLECTVECGLSDYIVHASLPDGSSLIISPPQEPPTDHPPGHPASWLVTRGHPDDSTVHEVIYDSEPGGPMPSTAAAPQPARRHRRAPRSAGRPSATGRRLVASKGRSHTLTDRPVHGPGTNASSFGRTPRASARPSPSALGR